MGLLDPILGTSFDDPRTQGAMALAQGLLSDPRPMRGLASGVSNYGQILAQAKQQKQREEAQAIQMQMQRMALEQALAQQQQAGVDKQALMKLFTPTTPINANAASGIAGPRPEALQSVGQTPKFDPISLYRVGASFGAVKQAQELASMGQHKIKDYKEVRMPDGSVQIVGFDEYGKPVDTGRTPFKDAQEMDLGGTKALRDPLTNQIVQQFGKTQTPDSVASNRLGWANNDIANQRLDFDRSQVGKPQFHDGQWLTAPDSANPAGTSVAVPGFTKQLTEVQGKATTFSARMLDAEKSLNELERKGVSGSDFGTLAASNMLTNPAASKDGQRYRQAQENWVTANLRQESGAAIGVDEMAKDIKKYFPIPGDNQPVRDQKTRARAIATQAMLVQAGPGAQRIKGIMDGAEASSGDASGTWDAPKPTAMQKLPTANASNKGRRIRDTETGKTLVSNGISWVAE